MARNSNTRRVQLDAGDVMAQSPKTFTLTRDDGSEFVFKEGVHPAALSDAEHWYAGANGVVIIDTAKKG